MSKYLESSVVRIFPDKNGEKIVHIMADSYRNDDDTETPYRLCQYGGGNIPLKEVAENGMPDGDWYANLKQFITDCDEKQLDYYYEHYNSGKMPRVIDQLCLDLPLGCYIVLN